MCNCNKKTKLMDACDFRYGKDFNNCPLKYKTLAFYWFHNYNAMNLCKFPDYETKVYEFVKQGKIPLSKYQICEFAAYIKKVDEDGTDEENCFNLWGP